MRNLDENMVFYSKAMQKELISINACKSFLG